jgi:recombination protein RecR
MNTLPNNLKQIALFLERLPGIGEKTANRLAFYLLRLPDQDLKEFAHSISELKTTTKLCKNCLNLTEEELCAVCKDPKRDWDVITVVESVLDLLSFETGNIYEGVYHVLHGRIDPLNHVGPDDIHISKLLERIEQRKDTLKEVVLATNPDMEGEATAMYIRTRVQELQKKIGKEIQISRLAYGLPMGANLEYADYMTLRKALEGRSKY